jgi:hypothetical protein
MNKLLILLLFLVSCTIVDNRPVEPKSTNSAECLRACDVNKTACDAFNYVGRYAVDKCLNEWNHCINRCRL